MGGSNPGLSLEEAGTVSPVLQKGRWDYSWEHGGRTGNNSPPSFSPNPSTLQALSLAKSQQRPPPHWFSWHGTHYSFKPWGYFLRYRFFLSGWSHRSIRVGTRRCQDLSSTVTIATDSSSIWDRSIIGPIELHLTRVIVIIQGGLPCFVRSGNNSLWSENPESFLWERFTITDCSVTVTKLCQKKFCKHIVKESCTT